MKRERAASLALLLSIACAPQFAVSYDWIDASCLDVVKKVKAALLKVVLDPKQHFDQIVFHFLEGIALIVVFCNTDVFPQLQSVELFHGLMENISCRVTPCGVMYSG